MRFRLHFPSGRTEVVTGDTIEDACARVGYAGSVYYSVCAEDTLHTGPLAVVLDALQTAEIAAKDAATAEQKVN